MNKLREARKIKGLTLKEVAEHLGIKIQSVYCLASKVKHGARNPKIKIYRIEGKNDEY